jgi:hypothetical protein
MGAKGRYVVRGRTVLTTVALSLAGCSASPTQSADARVRVSESQAPQGTQQMLDGCPYYVLDMSDASLADPGTVNAMFYGGQSETCTGNICPPAGGTSDGSSSSGSGSGPSGPSGAGSVSVCQFCDALDPFVGPQKLNPSQMTAFGDAIAMFLNDGLGFPITWVPKWYVSDLTTLVGNVGNPSGIWFFFPIPDLSTVLKQMVSIAATLYDTAANTAVICIDNVKPENLPTDYGRFVVNSRLCLFAMDPPMPT